MWARSTNLFVESKNEQVLLAKVELFSACWAFGVSWVLASFFVPLEALRGPQRWLAGGGLLHTLGLAGAGSGVVVVSSPVCPPFLSCFLFSVDPLSPFISTHTLLET